MAERKLTPLEQAVTEAMAVTSAKSAGKEGPLGKHGPLGAVRKSAARFDRRRRKAEKAAE